MRVRAIAFYLPQFHTIKENDEWWGEGFTEWTNCTKAKPLFPGHYQPHLPGSLGFYDLRVPESRKAQADMAAAYGIEGFCYYHYWFAGHRLLEQPLEAVLATKEPKFPFCICWANQTWSGIWHGSPNEKLVEQTYPGIEDDEAHFECLLRAFTDERYITVEGKPLLVIYDPFDSPRMSETISNWRHMASSAGLAGLHIVAYTHAPNEAELKTLGFDAVAQATGFKQRDWPNFKKSPVRRALVAIQNRIGLPTIASYKNLCKSLRSAWSKSDGYPVVVHAWDNTPRSGHRGVVYLGSTPERFATLLEAAIETMEDRPFETRLMFLKSWNEWAEGNHLEPDRRDGTAFLEALKTAVMPDRP